jgi:hypothetical protein
MSDDTFGSMRRNNYSQQHHHQQQQQSSQFPFAHQQQQHVPHNSKQSSDVGYAMNRFGHSHMNVQPSSSVTPRGIAGGSMPPAVGESEHEGLWSRNKKPKPVEPEPSSVVSSTTSGGNSFSFPFRY